MLNTHFNDHNCSIDSFVNVDSKMSIDAKVNFEALKRFDENLKKLALMLKA